MSRIDQEKDVIACMIKVYCHKKHHSKQLCVECEELKSYALKRLSNCRYGENKSFCSHCNTHCYAKKYKEKIKEVMRFSGPRIMFYHPIMVIKHFFNDLRH